MYNTIHKLPFHVFQDIIIEDNLSLLGEGTEQERASVWEDILSQYAEAIGESNRDNYLSDRRELLFFETQRFLVDALITGLSKFYIEKWAKMLSKIVQMKIVYTDKYDLYNQLETAHLRSKGLVDIHLIALRGKIADYEEKNKGSNLKPTREFFATVLINFHEHFNWQFNEREITTFQYCEMVKRYSQHIEYMETKKRA